MNLKLARSRSLHQRVCRLPLDSESFPAPRRSPCWSWSSWRWAASGSSCATRSCPCPSCWPERADKGDRTPARSSRRAGEPWGVNDAYRRARLRPYRPHFTMGIEGGCSCRSSALWRGPRYPFLAPVTPAPWLLLHVADGWRAERAAGGLHGAAGAPFLSLCLFALSACPGD